MTVSTTTRLGITRWSAQTDPFSRAQMDASHAALEANVAMFKQGTLAARPAFGTVGRFYFVTNAAASAPNVFYDTGTSWEEWKQSLTAYATTAAMNTALGGKANSVHTHVKADVTDFAHTHTIADLPVAPSGTSSATMLVRADDSRLSGTRPPAAHTHALADLPVAADGASSSTSLVRADDSRLSNPRNPNAHVHGIGDLPVAASGTSSATQLVRADDARLSNARPPTVHDHDDRYFTQAQIYDHMPIGVVLPYTGATAPNSRWVIAQGQALSRTTYADYFALVGTTYGAGNGTTTFNVPDLRDKFPLGASGTRPRGDVGGSATVTQTVAQMPSHSHGQAAHSHGVNDPGHSHSLNGNQSGSEAASYGLYNGAGRAFTDRPLVAGIANESGARVANISIQASQPGIDNTGGGSAMPILNPYTALPYIIKVL